MKHVIGFALILFVASLCFAQTNSAFETVKSLVGEWKGMNPDGTPVTIRYELASGGTTVIERLTNPDMVTTYYLDGSSLMMTHYCMVNNQPRMKAEAQKDNTVAFNLLDVTNLSAPDAGHMRAMVLTVKDANHIQESWTWSEKGKTETHNFQLERVK